MGWLLYWVSFICTQTLFFFLFLFFGGLLLSDSTRRKKKMPPTPGEYAGCKSIAHINFIYTSSVFVAEQTGSESNFKSKFCLFKILHWLEIIFMTPVFKHRSHKNDYKGPRMFLLTGDCCQTRKLALTTQMSISISFGFCWPTFKCAHVYFNSITHLKKCFFPIKIKTEKKT